jgi:hypothetical protein
MKRLFLTQLCSQLLGSAADARSQLSPNTQLGRGVVL